jgi:hypothetical protein
VVSCFPHGYRAAADYWVRPAPHDFEDASWVAELAKTGGFDTPEAFREHFAAIANGD